MPIDDSEYDRAMRAACAEVVRRFHQDMDIARQEDAALVAAMAAQAQEDAEIFDVLLDAGCSFDECRAALSDAQVIN